MQARLYFLHALSPLHAGTGQGVGVIDLPIAREKATNIPIVPGSSLKGVLRDGCAEPTLRKKVFGPEAESADEHASSIQITDAHLLLLPVRSLAGTFAWVTSPFLLHRLARDAEDAASANLIKNVPSVTFAPDGNAINCFVTTKSEIVLNVDNRKQVFLEDLDFDAQVNADLDTLAAVLGKTIWPNSDPHHAAWRAMLTNRLCLLPDDALSFLLETATEITARIKLQEATKTVTKGGLWYEEALPAETVLHGLAVADEVKASYAEVFETLTMLTAHTIQVGGNATVGRGFCRMHIQTQTGA